MSKSIAPRLKFAIGPIAAAMLLCACGGGTGGLTTQTIPALGQPAAEQPVALTRPSSDQVQKLPSALLPLKQARAEQSLKRYLLNQGGKPATHKIAGADLDGDGKAEALVYLEGEDWCVDTGCTLLIMRDGSTGYDMISLVKRVKLPIGIAPKTSLGWRDILVKTGQVGGNKLVALKFNGSGYPGNASTQIATVPKLTELPEIAIRPTRTAFQSTTPSTDNTDLIAGQN